MKKLADQHSRGVFWRWPVGAPVHVRMPCGSWRCCCWIALLCFGTAGCAALPAVGVGLAAQGAQGLVALSLGPLTDAQERAGMSRCEWFAAKGISVTETLETTLFADERDVATFEPAHWRLELAREGYPQVERSRTPTEGTLAIAERAVVFVPLPGATSVRIPYELVEDVAVKRDAERGEAGSLIVRSCFGRFDIVTFRQRPSNQPDPAATSAAATRLAARVKAFQAKESD